MRSDHAARCAVVMCLVLSSSIAHAERLTLDAIQTFANAQAPRLRVAVERVGVARAELAAADPSLPDNPVLDIAGGPRFSKEGTGFTLEAALTQSFFFDGQRGARMTAAKKAVLAAEANVILERWALHANIHQGFDRALVARERIALRTAVQGFQQRLADIAAKKVKAGEIANLDARLVEVELVEARQHTLAATTDYRVACLRLAALIGWDKPETLEPDGVLESAPLVALDALIAYALEHEPERQLMAAHVALAKARLAAEQREGGMLPAFGVALAHESGIGAEPSITSVQGVVSLPLPFSQRNQGGVARARAELRLAELERGAHEHGLRARLAEQHAIFVASIERVAVFGNDILPRMAENLEQLERGYAVGELGLTEVIIARERFVIARLDALEAHAARLSARAELERLVGSDLEAMTP